MLSRVSSPSRLPAAGEGAAAGTTGLMAVMSVGLLGLGAMGGGTLASSPPSSEDDEEESERRLAFCACAAAAELLLTSSGAVELDWGRLPTGEPPDVKPSSELCRLPPPRCPGSISAAAPARAAEGESERHL